MDRNPRPTYQLTSIHRVGRQNLRCCTALLLKFSAVHRSYLSGGLPAYSHAWRSLNNIHADHSITSMPIAQ
uniref:hypothetical protein n=1 Tax=Aeromonas sp. QDB11 TaxID=2990482 RepID=UPI0022E7560E